MNIRLLSFFTFLFSIGALAATNSPTFVYQGRLLNEGGTAPLTGTATLKLGIYDPNGNCLLYEEEQSVDLSGTAGAFSIQVGQEATVGGKRTASDPHNSMSTVFANGGAIPAVTSASCPGGSYASTAGASRKFRVTVTPQAGSAVTLSPDQVIGATPQSIVAETLQGLGPSQLILSSGTVTQSNLGTLTGASDASSLHHHDSVYAKKDAAANFTSLTIGGSNVCTTSYADTKFGGSTLDLSAIGDGKSIKWDAGTSKWIAYTPATGISLGTAAGTAVDIGTIPNCAANEKLQMSAGPTFLWSCVGDGSQWATNGSSISYGNGNVAVGTTSPVSKLEAWGASTVPANNPALGAGTFHLMVTDPIAQDIGPSISFAAYRDNGSGTALPRNLASIEARRESSTITANNGYLSFHTNNNGALPEAMRITSAGNVGIGTTEPQTALDVNGVLRLAKNAAEPFACAANVDGALAMTAGYITCVCKPGTGWVQSSDGVTSCDWSGTGKTTVTQTVTVGAACTVNGQLAQDGTGVLRSCQSGVWKSVGVGAICSYTFGDGAVLSFPEGFEFAIASGYFNGSLGRTCGNADFCSTYHTLEQLANGPNSFNTNWPSSPPLNSTNSACSTTYGVPCVALYYSKCVKSSDGRGIITGNGGKYVKLVPTEPGWNNPQAWKIDMTQILGTF